MGVSTIETITANDRTTSMYVLYICLAFSRGWRVSERKKEREDVARSHVYFYTDNNNNIKKTLMQDKKTEERKAREGGGGVSENETRAMRHVCSRRRCS